MTYALLANVFFVGVEFFTAFYSGIPEHVAHFRYLFLGLDGHAELVPFMWIQPGARAVRARRAARAAPATATATARATCVAVIVGIWIEKGLGMVVTGFVPTPLGHVTAYRPTAPELGISAGIYAFGALMVTGFYKIALSVRGEVAA